MLLVRLKLIITSYTHINILPNLSFPQIITPPDWEDWDELFTLDTMIGKVYILRKIVKDDSSMPVQKATPVGGTVQIKLLIVVPGPGSMY